MRFLGGSWRRKWQPTPVFLPGEFPGQGSLVGYGPWARQESDMTEHTALMVGGKEPACPCRRRKFHPGSGRSPGEGNGKPLQYSCLENSMDRGAWLARVHRVAKIQTWLSTQAQTYVGCSGRVILSVCVHLFQVWSRNLNPGLFRLSFKAMIFSETWSEGLRRSLWGF